MSDWQANGARVLDGNVCLPRIGVWHADLNVDTGDAARVTGAVTLTTADGSLSLAGTTYRVGAYQSKVRMLLVGGAARLAGTIGARWYTGASVTLGMVLGDLVRDAGERLSSACEAATLGLALPAYLRARGVAGVALRALLDATDASWRILPDGTLWVGHETWPAAPTFAYDTLDNAKDLARIVMAAETYPLLPGMNLPDATGAARHVSYLEHRIAAGHTRTEIWFVRAS